MFQYEPILIPCTKEEYAKRKSKYYYTQKLLRVEDGIMQQIRMRSSLEYDGYRNDDNNYDYSYAIYEMPVLCCSEQFRNTILEYGLTARRRKINRDRIKEQAIFIEDFLKECCKRSEASSNII